jgi:hypothetical protein
VKNAFGTWEEARAARLLYRTSPRSARVSREFWSRRAWLNGHQARIVTGADAASARAWRAIARDGWRIRLRRYRRRAADAIAAEIGGASNATGSEADVERLVTVAWARWPHRCHRLECRHR